MTRSSSDTTAVLRIPSEGTLQVAASDDTNLLVQMQIPMTGQFLLVELLQLLFAPKRLVAHLGLRPMTAVSSS